MLVIHNEVLLATLRAITAPFMVADGQIYLQAVESTPNRRAFFRYGVPWGPTRLTYPLGDSQDPLSQRVVNGISDGGSYLLTYTHSPLAIVISGITAHDHMSHSKYPNFATRAVGIQLLQMPRVLPPANPTATALSPKPRYGRRPLTVLHPTDEQPTSLAALLATMIARTPMPQRDPTIIAQFTTAEVLNHHATTRPTGFPSSDEGIGARRQLDQ